MLHIRFYPFIQNIDCNEIKLKGRNKKGEELSIMPHQETRIAYER